MGPISPGRWQVWQFFWRMGKTSLLNVIGPSAPNSATAKPRLKNTDLIAGSMYSPYSITSVPPRQHLIARSMLLRGRRTDLANTPFCFGDRRVQPSPNRLKRGGWTFPSQLAHIFE
jgi:hypothetical protein